MVQTEACSHLLDQCRKISILDHVHISGSDALLIKR